MEWTTTDWPDWKDAGRLVEIERDDGTVATGNLEVDDFFPDGAGDEVPVFVVASEDGIRHSFADNRRWRFVTPNSN